MRRVWMLKFLHWPGIAVALLAAVLWAAGQLGLFTGTPPSEVTQSMIVSAPCRCAMAARLAASLSAAAP